MNLLFPPKGEKLAYPVYSFDTANPGEKPMVLVIADSYYWNIFNTRIPKYIFANEAFWYFNTLVYPDHYLKETYTKDLNFQQEVEKQQVIFLMVTERFVHKFDWRFIDQLYALYTPGWLKDPVYDKINDIMQVAPWYEKIIESARGKHISLEEALILNGKYMYHYNDTAAYLINFGSEHFSNSIADDPSWMAQIREKANRRNISTDEMLQEDARYFFKKDFPGLYEMNEGLSDMEKRIYADIKLSDSLELEAGLYRFDPAVFIRIKAWQFYKEEEIQKTCNAIRSDPSWLEDVKQKALVKNIPLDEMILLDAGYMWEERIKKF
jgi:hypothetical protein